MGQASSSRRKNTEAGAEKHETNAQEKAVTAAVVKHATGTANTSKDASQPRLQQGSLARATLSNHVQGGWVVEKVSKPAGTGLTAKSTSSPFQTQVTAIKNTKRISNQDGLNASHATWAKGPKSSSPVPTHQLPVPLPGMMEPSQAPKRDPEAELELLMNGSRSSGYALFSRHDRDRDGFLSRKDLFQAFLELRLNLSNETYNQFVQCNFVYADRDRDGLLSFDDFLMLYHLICDMKRKFKRYDLDQDGFINKHDFTNIVSELNLNLDPAMLKEYVNLNFRFADRNFKGTISFGQFLTGYANFLYSYEVTNSSKAKTNAATTNPAWAAADGDVLL